VSEGVEAEARGPVVAVPIVFPEVMKGSVSERRELMTIRA